MAFFLPMMSSLGVPELPFTFRQRYGKVNWRLVQQVDIDEAVQLGDSSKLNLVKETLAFSHFEQDDLERFSDSLLVKAFRLMQLIIEHQDYEISRLTLDGDRRSEEFKTASQTISDLQARVKSLEEELASSTKELKNKVHILSTYEYILRQPSSTGLVSQMLSQHNAVKCPHCLKLFMSSTFLEQHITKRHRAVSQSMQEESRKQEHSRDMEATLESMKLLMTRNIQSINETHARQIEMMQATFQRKLEEMERAKNDFEKSRPGTAETADIGTSESVLREVLRSQQEIRSSMEVRDQTLRDQLRQIEERQLKSVSEAHKNEESFRIHLEDVIKKHVEAIPKEAAKRPTSADVGLQRSDDSVGDESEDNKGKSNAGEIESDEASGRFTLIDDESSVKPRASRALGVMSSNPAEISPKSTPPYTELPVSDESQFSIPQRNPVEAAAEELGVQKTEAANVEFVLRAYMKAKEQSPWQRTEREGKTCYQNRATGEIVDEHPVSVRFKQSLRRAQLLSEKVDYSSFLSLAPMNITQTAFCHDGIATLFHHKAESFQKHEAENKRRISTSVGKIKATQGQIASLQERHQERMRSEPAYRRYMEEVRTEVDVLYTKALSRRSLVEPAKTLFGKQLEKRFAEDKKMLRVDERDSRLGRDSL